MSQRNIIRSFFFQSPSIIFDQERSFYYWERALDQAFAIVVDIGKTLSKVTSWSRDGRLLDRQTRPNDLIVVENIPRLDVAGIGAWLLTALSGQGLRCAEYIVPVSHGAGVAALVDGQLAMPPLDYEADIPDRVSADYLQKRSPFAETGSPALPHGLNLGCQLAWMEQLDPTMMARATLVPWAQYWAWWLSGEARSEVTSLGCHTDLWSPGSADYSSMANARGWAQRFAPMAAAGEGVGALRPDLVRATGLSADLRVLAGLHDTNAALLAARGHAQIAGNEATVLSTGTWFIAMRLPASPVATADLPIARDCLVNVDVRGDPVPSARFMGGREIEALIEIDTRRVDIKPDQPALLAAVPGVLREGAMVLPTLAPGCGPFPGAQARWIAPPDDWFARRAAACLYAALMADQALDLIGSRERLLIEGRFAEAEVFVRALASLRSDTQVFVAHAHNDVSFGALRLILPELAPDAGLRLVEPLDAEFDTYRNHWLAAMDHPE